MHCMRHTLRDTGIEVILVVEQEWRCEKCETNGIIAVFKGDGVVEVVHRIANQHQGLSPKCDNSVEAIRLGHRGLNKT